MEPVEITKYAWDDVIGIFHLTDQPSSCIYKKALIVVCSVLHTYCMIQFFCIYNKTVIKSEIVTDKLFHGKLSSLER